MLTPNVIELVPAKAAALKAAGRSRHEWHSPSYAPPLGDALIAYAREAANEPLDESARGTDRPPLSA